MGRFLRGLGALILLIAVVAGVPFALILLGGNPFPERLGWDELVAALFRPDDGTVLMGLITIIAWMAWLVFTLSVFVEITGRISGYEITLHLPGMAGPQRWAAGLVVAVITMISIPAQAETRAEAAPIVLVERDDHERARPSNVPAPPAAGSPRAARDRPPEGRTPRTEAPAKPPAASGRHVVKPGDDLWSLAEHYYGDGRQWRKIALANPDLLSGGPDVLRPGWRLIIPDAGRRTAPPGDTLRVQQGDTLWSIAGRVYGDPERWPELYRANRFQLSDPDEIDAGMLLLLPSASEEEGAGRRESQRSGEADRDKDSARDKGPARDKGSARDKDSERGRERDAGPGSGRSERDGDSAPGKKAERDQGGHGKRDGNLEQGKGQERDGNLEQRRGAERDGEPRQGGEREPKQRGSEDRESDQGKDAERKGDPGRGRSAERDGEAPHRQGSDQGSRGPQPGPGFGVPEERSDRAPGLPGAAPSPGLPQPTSGTGAPPPAAPTPTPESTPTAPARTPTHDRTQGTPERSAAPDRPPAPSDRSPGVPAGTPGAPDGPPAGSDRIPGQPDRTPGSTDRTPAVPGSPDSTPATPAPTSPPPDRTPAGAPAPGASGAPGPAATEPAQALGAVEFEAPEVASAVAGLAGVGGLFAAAVVNGLAARRLVQLQRRPLGRRLLRPTAPARAVESALGRRQRPLNLRDLDQVLRALSAHCHATGTALPPLRLAVVGDDELELIMEQVVDRAPAGFTVRGTTWVVTAHDLRYLRTIPGFGEATRPYPALVGIGTDPRGRAVLADLEGMGVLAVDSDDPELAPAFLAAAATELSFSPWADELVLTLVGEHPRLAGPLGRHNVTQTDDLDGLLTQLERRAAIQRREQAERPVALLRSDPDLADPWAPEIVLIDRRPTDEQLERIGRVVGELPTVTMAIVVPGGSERSDWTLRLHPSDPTAPAVRAELLPLGLELVPQLLRPAAVDAVVELITATGTEETVPAPWWRYETNGHSARGHRLGRATFTLPTPASGSPPGSMAESPPLGADPPDPVTGGAWGESATGHERARAAMNGSGANGPGTVHHPTLRILGPIELAGASGPIPPRADKQCLEYCGWLLEHPGSTARAMAAALAVAEGTRRSNMSRLRSWLGTSSDGDAYLPDAYSGRIALHPAVSSDWHRLQILTLGGVNRAEDDALFAALELVRGAPLADAAPGQWHWAEELRTDMVSVVRDLGVELCRRALDRNDLDLARWSASRALVAAPGDELLMVARIRTEHQAGNHAETERLTLQLAGHARILGVDLDPETVRVLQQVMEGQVRARLV